VSYSVRQLNVADAEAFRALRLQALADSPEAFGGDYAEESQRPLETFTSQLTGSAVFGAFIDGALQGLAGLFWDEGAKRRHIGNLYTVYLAPQARGTGCALPLIEAVLDHARYLGKVQVYLGVGAANKPALRLYQKAGFEIYGTEPRALFVNGRYIDEHLMVRFLDKAPGKTDQND
jgi:RimJ/RimL family protein N-acetyltransferase